MIWCFDMTDKIFLVKEKETDVFITQKPKIELTPQEVELLKMLVGNIEGFKKGELRRYLELKAIIEPKNLLIKLNGVLGYKNDDARHA